MKGRKVKYAHDPRNPPKSFVPSLPPPTLHPHIFSFSPRFPSNLRALLQADVMRGQLNFVLEIVDMGGKCKKPGAEVSEGRRGPRTEGPGS